jgi:hypothetical protein
MCRLLFNVGADKKADGSVPSPKVLHYLTKKDVKAITPHGGAL